MAKGKTEAKATTAETFLNNVVATHKPEEVIIDQLKDFINEINTTLENSAKSKQLETVIYFDLRSEANQNGRTTTIALFERAKDEATVAPSEDIQKNLLLDFFIYSDADHKNGKITTVLGISNSANENLIDDEYTFENLQTPDDYTDVLELIQNTLSKSIAPEEAEKISKALGLEEKPQRKTGLKTFKALL